METLPKNLSSQDLQRKKAKKGCKLTKTTMLIIIISMTSSFFLVELIVGHITNSNALVADAFHMLSSLTTQVYYTLYFMKKIFNTINFCFR